MLAWSFNLAWRGWTKSSYYSDGGKKTIGKNMVNNG